MAGSVARLGIVVALGVMVGAASPARADVVINFDDLSSGTAVTTQYQSQGVIFSGATILTLGQSLSPAFPPHSGANVVYNSSDIIQANAVAGSTFSSVGGYITGNTSIFLDAYDTNGALIGSVQTPGANYLGSGGGDPNYFLSFSGQNIAFVNFHDGGSSFTMDDFTFNSSIVASPEPATIVSAGFGAVAWIGWRLRRRLVRRAA